MRARRRLSAGLVAVVCYATAVRPCGGPAPDYPIVEVTMPLAAAAPIGDSDGSGDDTYDDWLPPEEYRFLHPFRLALGSRIGRAWAIAYDGEYDAWRSEDPGRVPARVDVAPFEVAVRAVDLAGADRAAAAIVGEILDMPAVQAQANQPALRRAVEWLELRPHCGDVSRSALRAFFLGDAATDPLPPVLAEAQEIRALDRADAASFALSHPDSPRLPSLRYVALQVAMRTGISNGWGEEIRQGTPPETWTGLQRDHADWLKAFPTHPLADLVRLSRVRLFFFHGDAAGAWKVLLETYPRRAARVVSEMRHLAVGNAVDPKILDEEIPVEVASAIVGAAIIPEPATWTRLWARAHAMPPSPLRANFEERLLHVLEDSGPHPLPEGFPGQPDGLSPIAAKSRLALLIRQKEWDAAGIQAAALGTPEVLRIPRIMDYLGRGELDEAWKLAVVSGPDAAYYRARLRLERREAPAAILAENGFAPSARRYLLRVLFSPEEIASLVDAKAADVRHDAREALATRAAAKGDWARGAELMADDPKRGAVWRRALALRSGTGASADLAWARFLGASRGELFYEKDNRWQRSLGSRIQPLAPPRPVEDGVLRFSAAEESAAIERSLLESNELFAALKVYVSWLEKHQAGKAEPRQVLREADTAYNQLVNEGEGIPEFWKQRLERDGTAAALRRVGAAIRARD